MHGEQDVAVPGTAFAVDFEELGYSGLTQFGAGLLKRTTAVVSPAPLLQHMTLIDTPGVLSGGHQQLRRYISVPELVDVPCGGDHGFFTMINW